MNYNKKHKILASGKVPFRLEVPYTLIETGKKDAKKPLILYLHGFKDNIQLFREKCSLLLEKIEAFHLFIQGPYPLYESRDNKKVEDWGAAWYLYDGDQDYFSKSLEKTSEFIDEMMHKLEDTFTYHRICLIGYSMGGYLAGYYALTRPESVDDLIVTGARIKTEVLTEKWERISHLNILALHGRRDKLVDYKPQRNEIKRLAEKGINADFNLIDQKHIFNDEFVTLICKWLQEKNYIQYKHTQKD
jgi:predicted esterase